jgi:uncharacterized membrane protein
MARLLLALLGLGASVYLVVIQAASGVPLGCPATGIINCEQVLNHPSSRLLGVSLSWWGVAWFLVAIALIGGVLRGAQARWPRLLAADLAWSVLGALFVLYFVYLELWVIDAICLWCTAVHVIVLAMFCIRVAAEGQRSPP